MPRVDKKVVITETIAPDVEMVLWLLVDELNRLRQHLQLPTVTEGEILQAMKQYLKTHPQPQGRG